MGTAHTMQCSQVYVTPELWREEKPIQDPHSLEITLELRKSHFLQELFSELWSWESTPSPHAGTRPGFPDRLPLEARSLR